jgi:outer membrane protein TolC
MQRIIRLLFLPCLLLVAAAHAADGQPADLSRIKVLDLKTAQTIALADNPTMAALQARLEQARARVREAAASWWPSLDLRGSGTRQRLSDTSYQYNRLLANTLMPGAAVDRTSDNYSAGLEATWVLFDGFYRNFKEQQAVYDEQANIAALNDGRRMLVNAVAEAYLNAQLAQTYIDIAQADETFYNRQLEDAQNRYEVGAGPWGDILNIRVQVNGAKTTRIRSQREFEAARYGLASLMGIADADLPAHIRLQSLDREGDPPVTAEKTDTLIAEAISLRPDIRQLEMQLKQAEAAGGMAKAPLYPTVQLAGAIEGTREGDMGLSSEDFGNVVGVNMRWNLYAGGADKARMIESEQAKREVVHTLAGLRNEVAAEIRQYLAMLAAADEQVRLQRETVKLVQENRDLARNEYEAGEASLVRLNEAQRDLTATYGRLAQALVSRQLQQQRLLAATGRNLHGLGQASRE